MAKALEDTRVLDLSTSMAGAWCSRLCAGFGADVAMVEPPAGHPLRQLEPRAPDGSSIPARYVQADKRSIVVDRDRPAGRDVLADLAAACDVVIESAAPGVLAGEGLGFDTLERRRPGIVLVSITPSGQSGARAGEPGNNLTAYARSGFASINGLAAREPLKGSGFIASYTAGLAAYGAAVSALWHRRQHGVGQHIDVAEVETLTQYFTLPFLSAQYMGEPWHRRQATALGPALMPARDGHFYLTLGRNPLVRRDIANVLGLSELAEDEDFLTLGTPGQPAGEQMVKLQAQVGERTRLELFDLFMLLRVLCAPVLDLEDLAGNEHLRARDFYAPPAGDPDGPAYPGAPARLSATPWTLESDAPQPGEHTAAVLEEFAGYDRERIAPLLADGVVSEAAAAQSAGAAQ